MLNENTMKVDFDYAMMELRIISKLCAVPSWLMEERAPRTADMFVLFKQNFGPLPIRRREAVMATREKYK